MSLDDALEAVDEAADEDWKEVVARCIQWLAQTRRHLTTDDVWDAMASYYPDAATHEPRALGPAMIRAYRAGIITPRTCSHCQTAKVVVRSRREVHHSANIVVYESRIYGQ